MTVDRVAAQFEVDLAQRLAETDSPVALLEPRVEPLVYGLDGFVVTLWSYEPQAPQPVEFDLAHVPEEVSERYPNADQALLRECRGLVLAMVAAWRWDREDRLPNGRRAGRDLLDALREGPPWPALTTVLPPA